MIAGPLIFVLIVVPCLIILAGLLLLWLGTKMMKLILG